MRQVVSVALLALIVGTCGGTSATSPSRVPAPPALVSPYVPRSGAFKGQLHCHTIASDGTGTAAAMVEMYRQKGFQFVAITDHNKVTPDPQVPGILFVRGDEQSAMYHMSQFGAVSHKNLDGQQLIDSVLADGAAIVINHPHYSGLSTASLMGLNGYQGIEIFNGVVAADVANAEDMWDELLSAGKTVFGFATDDAHDATTWATNRAWIVVFADELSQQALISAIKAGNFYSSTGPTLSVSTAGTAVSVTTGTPCTIEWIGSGGRVLRTAGSQVAADTYTVQGDEGYVRVRVAEGSTGKKAWSNAVWVRSRS